MKSKILLSCFILCCVTLVSSAQINSGKILLGGSISYYKNKNTQPAQPFLPYSNYEYLYSNIQIGKFIKQNTAVGTILSYGYSSNFTLGNSDNKINQYSAGVFYRKYKSLISNFYFFGEGDALYSYSKNKQVYNQASTNITNTISNGASISFIPGISYNVWKKMQVELIMQNILSIGYSHVKTEYTYTNPTASSSNEGNIFSINTNLNSNLLANFGIGFKFFL